ncbi:uncharacterized protein LOC134747444 [Cydia strobilella]|uniref:uncharacterized protein LOC134747444 n=1 Tax=Cydia strobilella TaxID=1100964 RepID=UPI003007C784
MTAHSMFKLPIELVDDLGHWSVTKISQRGELIQKSDVIIYDEAPMAHKYLIHMLDRSLRDLLGSEKMFGGKEIIFAGRAILCTYNAGVEAINERVMGRLPNEPMHFFGVDKVVSEGPDELFFGPEALCRIQPNGVPEYDLVLKLKHGINIKEYKNLNSLLKRQSAGYKSKKSKIFNSENISKFLSEAPDDRFLAIKVESRSFPRVLPFAPAHLALSSGTCWRSLPLQYCSCDSVLFIAAVA